MDVDINLFTVLSGDDSICRAFTAVRDCDAAVLDVAKNVLGCFGKKLYGLFACERALK